MSLAESKKRKNFIYILFVISLLPFLFLIFDNTIVDSTLGKLANIFGYLGAVTVIWQFFLGIRGVSKRINPDYDWSIKIHTFLGMYGTVLIFLHPLLLMIDRNNSWQSMLLLNFSTVYNTYVSYGKIAFYLFLVIWITSALTRKLLQYRNWLYIHYISYLMLFFMLLHPFQIGSYLQNLSFIYWYWVLLCLTAISFVFIKMVDIFNLSFYKYKVLDIKNYPGDIYTITYQPINSKILNIKPGQYFYLKKNFIGEAHPFSILEYNDSTGVLTFGIKKLGKYSSLLGDTRVGDTHYLDGPFGEFTFEGQNYEPKVILAGGIGITPFYEVVEQFGNKDTYLFYANKTLDSALYREKFKDLLKNNYYDFVEQKEGEKNNVFCELISGQRIKELLSHKDLNELKYFICGSPGFTKGMISCLIDLGVTRKNIFIEEFEY